MKNIIVVSDDKTFGRELVHEISMKPDVKASLYSSNQYSNNEFQLSGNNYVIFFEKNYLSEDFIRIIPNKYSEDEVYWGYEGTKAFIYTENKWAENLPFSIPVCIKLLRNLIKIDKTLIYQLNYLKPLRNGDKIIQMVMDAELNKITREFVEPYKWNVNTVPLIKTNEIYKLSQFGNINAIKKKFAVHGFLEYCFEEFIK